MNIKSVTAVMSLLWTWFDLCLHIEAPFYLYISSRESLSKFCQLKSQQKTCTRLLWIRHGLISPPQALSSHRAPLHQGIWLLSSFFYNLTLPQKSHTCWERNLQSQYLKKKRKSYGKEMFHSLRKQKQNLFYITSSHGSWAYFIRNTCIWLFFLFFFQLLPLGVTRADHILHLTLSLGFSSVTPTLCISAFTT